MSSEIEKIVAEAPANNLPSWEECRLIIENDEFRQRAAAGREGHVLDTPRTTLEPTELHRFIYEYDDADPVASAWFLHRLEKLVASLSQPPAVDEAIAAMTQAEREEFLGRFCARYCLHCAAADPRCQCWNDE